MRLTLQSVSRDMLIVILLATLSLPSAWAQEQWYAECPDCAAHIGGSGVAGPYPSKEVCEQYVQRMRNQGFPFGDCHPGNGGGSTSSDSSGGFSARAIHKHWFLFGVVGGVVGGSVSYALSPTLDQPQLGNNTASGAAVGFLSFTALALLIGHDHSADAARKEEQRRRREERAIASAQQKAADEDKRAEQREKLMRAREAVLRTPSGSPSPAAQPAPVQASPSARVLEQYQPKIRDVDGQIHRAQETLRRLISSNSRDEDQRLEWTRESEQATVDAQNLAVSLVIDLIGAHADHLAEINGGERREVLNHLLNRSEEAGRESSIHTAYGILINRKSELDRLHDEIRLADKENQLRQKLEDLSSKKGPESWPEIAWDTFSQFKKVERLAGPSKDLIDSAYTIYRQAVSFGHLAEIQANQEKTLQAATVLRSYIIKIEKQKEAHTEPE